MFQIPVGNLVISALLLLGVVLGVGLVVYAIFSALDRRRTKDTLDQTSSLSGYEVELPQNQDKELDNETPYSFDR